MLLALQRSMNDKIIRSFAQETEDNFNKCIGFRDVSHTRDFIYRFASGGSFCR